jgi:hypothetical protein
MSTTGFTGIRLRTVPNPLPPRVAPRYDALSYALSAWPDGQRAAGAHRASIDTLTLSFTPGDHVWVGLDAYTNAERWQHEQLDPPTVDVTGSLICQELFDENGIGPSYPGPVRYQFARERSLMRLRTLDAPVASCVRFLSAAVAGLDADGILTDIWIEGVVA